MIKFVDNIYCTFSMKGMDAKSVFFPTIVDEIQTAHLLSVSRRDNTFGLSR